jgi:hypothetical protein
LSATSECSESGSEDSEIPNLKTSGETEREAKLKIRAFELLRKTLLSNSRLKQDYHLTRILGWGGVGIVLEAIDIKKNRKVFYY